MKPNVTSVPGFQRSLKSTSRTTGGALPPVIRQKMSRRPPPTRSMTCARTSLIPVYLTRDTAAVSCCVREVIISRHLNMGQRKLIETRLSPWSESFLYFGFHETGISKGPKAVPSSRYYCLLNNAMYMRSSPPWLPLVTAGI